MKNIRDAVAEEEFLKETGSCQGLKNGGVAADNAVLQYEDRVGRVFVLS